MKSIIIMFCSLISVSMFAQQKMEGRVINNTGDPLIGAIVKVKNTDVGDITDGSGQFEILTDRTEANTLVVSYVGYKTKEFSVQEMTENIDVMLYPGNELIEEVNVLAERANKFAREETDYVSKLPLKDMENAVVYSTVTTEILESQIVTNFDDAMKNATGVSKLWESTGRAPGEGTSYFSTRGFATQPALVDGMPGYTFSAIDPSYIERIEVIKGPSATLFGSTVTSLGGLVNVVTKKPYNGFGGSVSYTGGSFGLNRISGDINTPIGKSDKLFFRTNASYLTQDSFQDNGFRETFFVAPSLSYKASNRLSLSAGVEFSQTEQTNPSMLFLRRGLPLISTNVDELGVDPNKSFTSDDITLTSPNLNTRVIADYKLSDQWTSQTVFASTNSKVDGYYQYMVDGAAAAFLTIPGLLGDAAAYVQNDLDIILAEAGALLQQDVYTRIYDQRNSRAAKQNFQQNFIGDFTIGTMRNRLVFGLDYVNRTEINNNKSGNPLLAQNSQFPNIVNTFNYAMPGAGDQFAAQLATLPYFDGFFTADGEIVPTSFTPNAKYSVSKEELDAIFANINPYDKETGSRTYAAYASDVLNITDHLIVNVGLRLDHFDQQGDKDDKLDDYTKTTFSPNAGIVYQPIPERLTLFTNYQTGFINNDPAINQDGTVSTFAPTEAKQFEGGLKTNFLQGKLNAGISYYHITVNNTQSTDPRTPLFPISILINELVSQGVELEANTNPIDGLNIRASYSNNQTEYTDVYSTTTDITYNELDSRRPEEAGPESIYNFWADYKFQPESALNNFGFGLGFNGASAHETINNGVTGVFTLPAYTIFNATAYYDHDKFRLGLKANNFTDETYYNGWSTVNAQAPANFLGIVSYKFQ